MKKVDWEKVGEIALYITVGLTIAGALFSVVLPVFIWIAKQAWVLALM